MKIPSLRVVGVTVAAALAGGLCASLVLLGGGFVPAEPAAVAGSDLEVRDEAFFDAEGQIREGTNERGETFGALPETEGVKAPDLVAVYATNGSVGFVRSIELAAAQGSSVKNPEEARQLKPSEVVLEVFASDGRTVIGEYPVVVGKSAGLNFED